MLSKNQHNINGVLQADNVIGLRGDNNIDASLCLGSGDGGICIKSNRSSEFDMLNGDKSLVENLVNSYLCNRTKGSELPEEVHPGENEQVMTLYGKDVSALGDVSFSSQTGAETTDDVIISTVVAGSVPASQCSLSPSPAEHRSVRPDRAPPTRDKQLDVAEAGGTGGGVEAAQDRPLRPRPGDTLPAAPTHSGATVARSVPRTARGRPCWAAGVLLGLCNVFMYVLGSADESILICEPYKL